VANRDQAIHDLVEGCNVDLPTDERKTEKLKDPPDLRFRSHGLAFRIEMKNEFCDKILVHYVFLSGLPTC